MILGTTGVFRINLTNPDTGAPEDAVGALRLVLIDPTGAEHELEGGAIEHEGEAGSGKYFANFIPEEHPGEWHYEWLVEGEARDEGDFTVETKFRGAPDLTDLRVLVPRARRACEGPWGNPNGRPPLADDQIYDMVADGCAKIVMLGGKLFNHELIVKARDPLGGYPTEWKTNTPLEEYESAIVCAQVALDYYTKIFATMRISETIKNEGTEWAWSLSANVLRSYLDGLKDERDRAILGLRINRPLLDRFASNIRVRDQATVAVLEWWAGYYDVNVPGGLPGGQEAAVVPVFYPPGIGGEGY